MGTAASLVVLPRWLWTAFRLLAAAVVLVLVAPQLRASVVVRPQREHARVLAAAVTRAPAAALASPLPRFLAPTSPPLAALVVVASQTPTFILLEVLAGTTPTASRRAGRQGSVAAASEATVPSCLAGCGRLVAVVAVETSVPLVVALEGTVCAVLAAVGVARHWTAFHLGRAAAAVTAGFRF